MTKGSVFAALMALAVLAGTNMAQDKKAEGKQKKQRKFAAKCVITGKAAKKDKVVAYKNGDIEGKVYVCCGNCLAKLEKDVKANSVDAKIATKSNAQLVQTHQYRQTKCPISGAKVDDTKTVKVGARKVKFCCGKCVAKVEGETDKDKQLALVFSTDAFKKGFAKRKARGKGKNKKKKSAA
jgi:hypothetical protein